MTRGVGELADMLGSEVEAPATPPVPYSVPRSERYTARAVEGAPSGANEFAEVGAVQYEATVGGQAKTYRAPLLVPHKAIGAADRWEPVARFGMLDERSAAYACGAFETVGSVVPGLARHLFAFHAGRMVVLVQHGAGAPPPDDEERERLARETPGARYAAAAARGGEVAGQYVVTKYMEDVTRDTQQRVDAAVGQWRDACAARDARIAQLEAELADARRSFRLELAGLPPGLLAVSNQVNVPERQTTVPVTVQAAPVPDVTVPVTVNVPQAPEQVLRLDVERDKRTEKITGATIVPMVGGQG